MFFIEYVKRNQHTGFLSVPVAAKTFLHGFHVAHQAIIESSRDEFYSDLGTTTMIGGSIVALQKGTWGFICAGIGDCKAFHFSLKNNETKVTELAAHPMENRKDMTDPGGRLGPQEPNGNPDLRNFYCWFEELLEGDIVMTCSDGVHDNLDPQSHGLLPNQLGLEYQLWDQVEVERLQVVKTTFVNSLLERLYHEVYNENNGTVTMEFLTQKIIQYCFKQTLVSKEFMEQHPNKPLPSDYSLFPGKLDHATCVCVRVKRCSMGDHLLEECFRKVVPLLSSRPFAGRYVVEILCKNLGKSEEEAHYLSQLFLGFKFIISCKNLVQRYPFSFTVENFYEVEPNQAKKYSFECGTKHFSLDFF
eukprot:TRINITY_DN1015_c0_g2_i1.p1 TRINITY_DN1015_c0_g2~~TRINITY_DN1015_c0_g2_i1.p1  ORF type:complete len:360 (+),score=57.58 TRINITY_DN1015_c0_g2_i1:342-1421(+)